MPQGHTSAHSKSSTELVGKFVSAWSARERRGGNAPGPFVLDGAKISDDELGSPEVLLPLFAWHADNLFGYGIRQRGMGINFREDGEAMLGHTVGFDRSDRSSAEMLMFVLEALEDARQHLPRSENAPTSVELRGLVNRFVADVSSKLAPAAVRPRG